MSCGPKAPTSRHKKNEFRLRDGCSLGSQLKGERAGLRHDGRRSRDERCRGRQADEIQRIGNEPVARRRQELFALYSEARPIAKKALTFLAAKMSKNPECMSCMTDCFTVSSKKARPRRQTLGEHELFFIKYKGSFMDGREFDHHNQYPKNLLGGWPAW